MMFWLFIENRFLDFDGDWNRNVNGNLNNCLHWNCFPGMNNPFDYFLLDHISGDFYHFFNNKFFFSFHFYEFFSFDNQFLSIHDFANFDVSFDFKNFLFEMDFNWYLRSFNHRFFNLDFNELKDWALNNDTFLNNFRNSDNLFNDPWDNHNLFDDLLNFDYSGAFYNFLHDSFLNTVYDFRDFFFNVDWNGNFNSYFFNYLVCHNESFFDFKRNWLISFNGLWNFFINHNQFLFIAVERDNFFHNSFNIHYNLFNQRLLHDDFHIDNMFNFVTFDEMTLFNDDFLLNFFDQFLLKCDFDRFWFLAVTVLDFCYSFFSDFLNFYWYLFRFIDDMFLVEIADFRLDEDMRHFPFNDFVLYFFLDYRNIIWNFYNFGNLIGNILWTFNIFLHFLNLDLFNRNFD